MKKSKWTSDNKVTWYTSEEDMDDKLASELGEKYVEYRKTFDSVNRFEIETKFPLYLQVELHQICNLRCEMCPITVPEARAKYITDEHLSWELYEKIILEAEKYDCPSLNPQGTNEPLLYQNLEDHIKFAKKHGFIDIMMNTNATLLSEERSKKILESGLTRLRFSLDAATKETFEKIRIGADYESVMKNIERCVELRNQEGYNLPVIGVNFVKMKVNEHETEEFIEKWKDKVDFVVIQEFVPPELECDYSEFYPSDSSYQKEITNSFNCQQPWQRLFVHNTGDVSPCCTAFSAELSLGNVGKDTLHQLWNGDVMKNLRKIHKAGNYHENKWCEKCVNGMCGKPNTNELLEIKKIPAPR